MILDRINDSIQRTNILINLRSTEISDNRSVRSIIGELPAERESKRERERYLLIERILSKVKKLRLKGPIVLSRDERTSVRT